MYFSKTILIVSAISGIVFATGIGSMFTTSIDEGALAKKAALETHKFSAAQLPTGAMCYDHILAANKNLPPSRISQTCKCLVSEVDKYGPELRPALQSLLLIGLQASVETSDQDDRNEFIKSRIVTDKAVTSLPSEQHPLLQSGIKNVTRSCKMPAA